MSEGDRLLTIAGVVIVCFVLAALGVVALSIANAPSEGEAGAPDANFTVTRLNDTYARVVHAGGEPVSSEDLVVTVDGSRRPVTWSGAGFVNEGDGTVVRANPNQRVRVFWQAGHGQRDLLGRSASG